MFINDSSIISLGFLIRWTNSSREEHQIPSTPTTNRRNIWTDLSVRSFPHLCWLYRKPISPTLFTASPATVESGVIYFKLTPIANENKSAFGHDRYFSQKKTILCPNANASQSSGIWRSYVRTLFMRRSPWLLTVNAPSGRLIWWRLRPAEFYFEVKYKKGKVNTQADVLSRLNTMRQMLMVIVTTFRHSSSSQLILRSS